MLKFTYAVKLDFYLNRSGLYGMPVYAWRELLGPKGWR